MPLSLRKFLIYSAVALLPTLAFVSPTRAGEVVEEIVALVDGDILTASEFEFEEEAMVQDIYRRFTGEQVDQAVEQVKISLLMDLIDRKILVHRAGRMFDTDRMREVFYESFREQQQIEDEDQFVQALAKEGMTVEDLKTRLIGMFAPDEVIRFEVSSRISIADREVDEYYAANPEEFKFEDEVVLREIILMADDDAKKEERRADANQLWQELTAENFVEKAGEFSDSGTKGVGGLLGTIKRGDLAEDLERIAFALASGEKSEVLERPYGFHILFAETARVDLQKSLEEVRDELRLRLEDGVYVEKLKEFMVKARSESEWCVRSKFVDRVPARYGDRLCREM
jgi:parvulin-like peptidyl-prolyl isomerase